MCPARSRISLFRQSITNSRKKSARFLLYHKVIETEDESTSMDLFDILGALIALTALARLMLV